MLELLQRQDCYLFHGSDSISDLLSPRLARNHGQRDDRARVFATKLAAIAVFHALARTGKRSNPDLSRRPHGFSVEDGGQIGLRIDCQLFQLISASEEITNIYILDRRDFVERSPMEWTATRSVEPIGVVFVRGRDLIKLRRPGVTLQILGSASGPSRAAR